MESFEQWLFDPTIGRIVAAIVGVILVVVVIRIIQRSITTFVTENETRYRARKAVRFAGYMLSVVGVATVFSDRLGGLTVAFGVAGAGIAFALQEVIASVAGWFAISFAQFYRTGDRVQLGGIKGDVIDVGVLRTTIMEVGQWIEGDLYNGRIVRIANSFVFKEPVFNYSGDFPFLWDEIKLPVRYGSDYGLARDILNRVADELLSSYAQEAKESWRSMVSKFMIEDARVDPWVTMVANDNWVEFTLRYVVDYRRRRGEKDRLFARLLEEIAATSGKVQLGSATFELVGAPPVSVTLTDGSAGVRKGG